MSIALTGSGLTLEKLVRIARDGERVELTDEAMARIRACREMLEQKVAAHEIMYGVNTGIGEFSEVVLTDDQVRQFQRYLIYNHAAGIGDPAPLEHVRAAMASRINVHAHGNSGCRLEITQTLVEMLNRGVTPVVCQKGSVGASGDLAPMSQIALLLLGEGEAFYQGQRLPGLEAMERAGIPVPDLEARDGLAAINGSNVLTGMSALQLYDMQRWLRQAEIACAMSLEALLANLKPYDLRVHQVRGFPGAVELARAIMKCIEGSRPGDRQTQEQGPGRLLDALLAAGDRCRSGCAGLRPQPGRDRTERGGRQPHLPAGVPAHPDRRQLPGLTRVPAHGHGRSGDHHGVRALRATAQPLDQPGPERRAAGLSDQGRGDVLGDDAQPVHGRHADRRAAYALRAGLDRLHSGRGRSGGFRLDGHEHAP